MLPSSPGAAAATGCSSGGACVNVREWVNGTDTLIRALTASDLASEADIGTDNHPVCYETRFAGQGSNSHPTHCVSNALSIHTLLADTPDGNAPGKSLADGSPFTAVPRPDNGTWSFLTSGQVAATPSTTGAFESSGGAQEVPVVDSIGGPNAGPIEYVRPLTGTKDTNVQDIFTTADADDAMTIYVFTGQMLTVKASADKQKVQVGKPAHFTAAVTGENGAAPTASLDYSWSFGDGTTASTTAATHSFTRAGVYVVLLRVTGSTDGSGGMSKPLFITVGKPPPPKSGPPQPGAGSSPPPSPPASSPPSPAPVTAKHPGPVVHASPGAGSGSAKSQVPQLKQAVLGGSAAVRLGGSSAGQQPKLAAGSGALPLVSGQVVGAGAPLSLSAAASESAATVGNPPADVSSARWSPGVIPIYVGVVLLLLGVGIGRERGWLALRHR